MKKRNFVISLFFCFIAAVILNGCVAALKDGLEDNRVYWDSVSQVPTGKPNQDGEFTTKEALDASVTGAMIKKITDTTITTNMKPEKPASILRISGSLFGLVVNPSRTKILIIDICRKEGGSEPHTLLPGHAREVYLPPGEESYNITYSYSNKTIEEIKNYSVTLLKNPMVALKKGYKYEKLQSGSMTEYEEITVLTHDISVSTNFAFIGPGY